MLFFMLIFLLEPSTQASISKRPLAARDVVRALEIPAHVNRVLNQRCLSCHDGVRNKIGHLNLSRWTQADDGTTNFLHKNLAGRQYSRRETFRSILDRIQTVDRDERMPLGNTLSPEDLNALTSWVEHILETAPILPFETM